MPGPRENPSRPQNDAGAPAAKPNRKTHPMTTTRLLALSAALLTAASAAPLQLPRQPHGTGEVAITGTNTQWQPLTLTLDGPFAHELDNQPNPFTGYRFAVTFTHQSGQPNYTVPGYFAADGNAAESSAQAGTKWRAHLSPDTPGNWTYVISFTGRDATRYDGIAGDFTIQPAPTNAPGFYRHGRLTYVGKHHLQFAGSKQYFLKVGADAPETLLGYADFDGTVAHKPKVPLKTFHPHLGDWKPGDPTWQNGRGKGLIGALNYLSAKGMNAFSFIPYNAGGDGDNVWPFTSRDDKFHYDCSKLDQWNIVFTHAQSNGLFLHFKLQETENDDNRGGHKTKTTTIPTSLDGGNLGPERKLYLRELIARFGHHLALNWNLGEENTQSTRQQLDMANFIASTDAYHHHIVIHSYPNQQDKVYQPLLGNNSPLTGASLQNSSVHDCHRQVAKWTAASAKAGKPWAVAFDEPGDARHGVPPDLGYPGFPQHYNGPSRHDTRRSVLWGTLLAGGWGVEYYFGYQLPQNDLLCQDWRSRDNTWDDSRIALDIFRNENIPFWDMTCHDELIGADVNQQKKNGRYCFAKPGEIYMVFLPEGGNATVHGLTGAWSLTSYHTATGQKQSTSTGTGPTLPAATGETLHIIRTERQ